MRVLNFLNFISLIGRPLLTDRAETKRRSKQKRVFWSPAGLNACSKSAKPVQVHLLKTDCTQRMQDITNLLGKLDSVQGCVKHLELFLGFHQYITLHNQYFMIFAALDSRTWQKIFRCISWTFCYFWSPALEKKIKVNPLQDLAHWKQSLMLLLFNDIVQSETTPRDTCTNTEIRREKKGAKSHHWFFSLSLANSCTSAPAASEQRYFQRSDFMYGQTAAEDIFARTPSFIFRQPGKEGCERLYISLSLCEKAEAKNMGKNRGRCDQRWDSSFSLVSRCKFWFISEAQYSQ